MPWGVHSLLPTTDVKGGPDGLEVPGASGLAEVTGPLFSPNNPSLAPPAAEIEQACVGAAREGGRSPGASPVSFTWGVFL